MQDLLTARRYLGRVRATTMVVALVAVIATAPDLRDVAVVLLAVAVVVAQVALWLFGPASASPVFIQVLVAVDLVLLSAANSLCPVELFPLLVVPVIYLGAWLSLMNVAWAVILGSGLYALSSPAPASQADQVVSAALNAAVLGLVGAAANRLSAIHRGARRRWRALVDLPSHGRGLASVDDLRLLTEVLDGLMGAEHAMLFVRRGHELVLDEARLSMAAEEADVAQALGRTDLVGAALQSGRPIAVRDCAREPRLPRELVGRLGLRTLLAVPLREGVSGHALIVLANRSQGVPFEDDDAGVAALVVASAMATQPRPSAPPPDIGSPDRLVAVAMEAVFEAGDAGAVVIDGEKRIVTFNHVAESLLGLRNERVGQTVEAGIGDEAVRDLVLESVQMEAPRTLRSAPREAPWSAAEALPLFLGESRIGTLVLVSPRDDQAARGAVDSVLSCVSHELRTPLTAIRAYTDTLLRGASFDESTRRQFLSVVKDQTRRLSDAVDELLAAADKGEPLHDDGTRVTLAEAVSGALQHLAYCTEGLSINVTLLDDSPRIDLPATTITAGVHHLLLDAFTRSSHSEPIAITETHSEGSVSLSVEFVPDATLCPECATSDTPMSLVAMGPRPGGGLGLGLYLAERTLEPLGGHIEIGHIDETHVRWAVCLPV